MQNEIEKRISRLEQQVKELQQKSSIVSPKTKQGGLKKKTSIKEFLLNIEVNGDVKRTLAITYFLEYVEGKDAINIIDLKKAFRLAKLIIPKNVNDKVNINVKNAHMMEAEKKKDKKKAWVLTTTGEQYILNEIKKSKKNE